MSNLVLLLALAQLPTTVPVGEEPLVDVEPLHPAFQLDIRYATKDNFAKVKAYPVAKCLLRASVAKKMVKAQRWLDKKYPGTYLIFKDCYRPNDVQAVLWDAVKNTKMRRYVANPHTKTGSIHSYGAAVDLTLGRKGQGELAMGTPYDFLGKLAEPRHEQKYLASGQLTKKHVKNRKLLRRLMTKVVGLRMIRNEWWHFNLDTAKNIRKRFTRLNVPLTSATSPAKR